MKWKGLLQPDPNPDENQGCHPQLNTIAKNPKVVKEVIFISLFLFDFTISIGCHFMIIQVPQPFDHSLAIMMLQLFSYGFITPLVVWTSNKKLQTYTIREFWDEAPTWMVNLKHLYFPENIQVPVTSVTCSNPRVQNEPEPPTLQCETEEQMHQELRTIAKEIDQRSDSRDTQLEPSKGVIIFVKEANQKSE